MGNPDVDRVCPFALNPNAIVHVVDIGVETGTLMVVHQLPHWASLRLGMGCHS